MDKIHYTQLPPGDVEWETYRREAARLLQEGYEGKWVLIKGTQVVGAWDTDDEAYSEYLKRYWKQPALIHQVQEWERMIRLPTRFYLWPHLFFPSTKTG